MKECVFNNAIDLSGVLEKHGFNMDSMIHSLCMRNEIDNLREITDYQMKTF